MSRKKTIAKDRQDVEWRYSNWFSQLTNLLQPKVLTIIAGRGTSKTTDILAERIQEMAWEMPGAPVVLVSDTYANLQKNVLPTLLEGFRLKGWEEGVHYVIEKEPPKPTAEQIRKCPPEFREHFWKPYNIIPSYKHRLIVYTGLNVTFVSLDRPSAAAGYSYVALLGDEVKYFQESKIAKLTKAVRGYMVKYGRSPFYRSLCFTTDMPDPNNIGEYNWLFKYAELMDPAKVVLALKTAFVVNDIRREMAIAEGENDKKEIALISKKLERWEERLKTVRKDLAFFFIVSSLVNVDILGLDYFSEEFKAALEDVRCAILSMKPQLTAGNRFYMNLAEQHFFRDGNHTYYSEMFGLRDKEDCRILKYLDTNSALEAGVDFGNMCSMALGQPSNGNKYRVIKSMFTLPPEFLDAMGKEFVRYFEPHKQKTLKLYYDRSGNNYSKVKEDQAGKLKHAIEYLDGKRTGWKVILMSEGQGNIESNQEYVFMIELMGNNNPKLPTLLIDMFNCKELKSSLENAPVKIGEIRGRKTVKKEKSSEKLPVHRLPMESTNFSDAFKYLMCRREWMRHVKFSLNTYVGSASVR